MFPGTRSRLTTLLALVVLTAPNVGADVFDHRWCETRTPFFTLVSDLSERRAAKLALDLMQFHAAAQTVVDYDATMAAPPLDIIAFKRSRDLRRVFAVRRVAGFSASSHERYTLVIGPRYGRLALDNTAAFHEYTHYLMRSRPTRYYATWYAEGYASFLSTIAFTDDRRFVLGRIPFHRLHNAARDYNLPLVDVVAYHHVLDPASEDFLRVYERAWVLIHYLLLGDKAGFARYADKVDQILARIDAGTASRVALESGLGVTLAELEVELQAYAGVRRPPSMTLDYPQVDAARATTCLADLDVRRVFAEAVANRNPALARTLFEALLRANPDDVAALIGLSRLHAERAAALAERALELAPNDPGALVRWAEIDLADCQQPRSGGCTEHWVRAVGRYRKALAADPDRADAAFQLGIVLMLLNDARAAIAPLVHAHALAPWRPQIHLYLGDAYRMLGELEQARFHLRRAALWHPEPGGRRRAAAAVETLAH